MPVSPGPLLSAERALPTGEFKDKPMCDPVSMGIATAVGAGLSLVGSIQSANAQRAQSQAIADANRQTQVAQNQAFTQRINAGVQQTGAQTAAAQETLSARNQAATQMRQQQQSALQNYQDTLNAENTQAAQLRQQGDTAAQNLTQNTSADALAAAEAQRRAQAATLLSPNQQAEGPQESNPAGDAVSNDPAVRAALARRTAEAATNIRDYGTRIAAAGAYGASPQLVGLNVADTRYGIMPAEQASNLLQSGSRVRLLPTQTAYQAATGMGQAQDVLAQSRGQNALDAAGLSYGNATSLANLQQADTEQMVRNNLAQTQANLQARQAQAGIISGIGQLGLYGGGRYFGGDTSVGGLSNIFSRPSGGMFAGQGVLG